MTRLQTAFTAQVGVVVPIVCGAMYPCSNPELVAAVSAAGGIGVIQPVAMVYAHGHRLRDGIRRIRSVTTNPIGFNAIVENVSRIEQRNMLRWIDIALEEGVRFFTTALGNPRRVVDRVHDAGGVVYHAVTDRRWALRALDGGVDGLIAVNADAGGHAGKRTPTELRDELGSLGRPILCAGGIGHERDFVRALELGYAGVQMGTRFIATTECTAHADHKRAILDARPEDIVLTEKISGVPVAVIETEYVRQVGTKAGPIAKRLLQHPKLKRVMRGIYALRSTWQLKRVSRHGQGYRGYFQAGRSVGGIERIEPAGEIVSRFVAAALADPRPVTK